MTDLLLECAIFCPISGNLGNYYQLSGMPVSDVKPQQKQKHHQDSDHDHAMEQKIPNAIVERNPNAIVFVRSRMMYAKAALNAKGGVRFGMRHIRKSLLHDMVEAADRAKMS